MAESHGNLTFKLLKSPCNSHKWIAFPITSVDITLGWDLSCWRKNNKCTRNKTEREIQIETSLTGVVTYRRKNLRFGDDRKKVRENIKKC